jgi:hypothetical protein
LAASGVPETAHASLCFRIPDTCAAHRREITPSRLAARASIVAIFAGRTTEAMGSPAAARSSIATSSGQQGWRRR